MLANDAKIALLNRAIQLESRSFLEYMAQTAPPVDLAKYPHVAKIFHEIAQEEDLLVAELVDQIEPMGAHADALGSYDLTFTSYNYVTTAYALKVIAQQLKKNLERFDAILADAKGDPLEARLKEIRAKKADQLARVERLQTELHKPPAPAAPPATPAPAHPAH